MSRPTNTTAACEAVASLRWSQEAEHKKRDAQCLTCGTIQLTPQLSLILNLPIPLFPSLQIYQKASVQLPTLHLSADLDLRVASSSSTLGTTLGREPTLKRNYTLPY